MSQPMTAEQLRAQIQAGPQTQEALNQAYFTYTPEQLAAAFPEHGGVEQYRTAAEFARTQQGANGGNPNTALNTTPAAAPVDNWMSDQWYNPNVMPENFDWQRYVAANQDLGQAGIDTQEEAMRHYFNYGQQENRNIGALTPQQGAALSPEDYKAALKAYRDATGDDRVLTGVTADGQSDYGPVNDWIDKNYIPQGKFVTDYSAPKPMEKFELLNQMQTSNRPPEQLASIQKAWEANKDKPSEMRRLMQEYGVTLGDLSQATGETYSQLNTWVKGGDVLGVVGFSVNKPGAYDKYKKQTTAKYDPNSPYVTGPSTPESRLADFQSSQQRAKNTFDPVAYAKDPEGYAKKMREQGGLAGLVADKAAPAITKEDLSSKEALKITPANFETEYNKLRENPDLTDAQMKTFLTDSLKDPIIKEKLGSQLQPLLDELNKPGYFSGKTAADYEKLGGVEDTTKHLADQIYKQHTAASKAKVDLPLWTGDVGDKDTAMLWYADFLRKKGITDLNDIGQREVDVEFATNEAGTNFETRKEKEIYNKKTGETLSGGSVLGTAGDMQYEVAFDKNNKPILYTTNKPSEWVSFRDNFVKPVVSTFGSLAFPALAPYIQGANALNAASKGNWAGALVSGIGALGGPAGFAQDLGIGADAMKSLGTVKDLAGIAGAIQNKDLLGLAGSASSLGGFGDMKLGDTDFTTKQALFGVSALDALQKGDYTKLINIGAQLSKSPEIAVAAQGANLLQAVKSGNPAAIIGAVTAMAPQQKTKEKGEKEEPVKSARGGLLEGPAPVKVPGNASGMDPRMFTGIAANLMARSM